MSVYIAMNPVRAGFCRHPLEWAHGSYRAHAGGEIARPHLTISYTHRLFAERGTSMAAAIDAAIDVESGGRPALASFMPGADRLTLGHVIHARDVYGYRVPEIASHYGRSTRTITRWLSDAYEPPRLKRLSTSQ